jgi:hypothetical protein
MIPHQDPNVKRWLNSSSCEKLRDQILTDMCVARHNLVNPKVLQNSLEAFLEAFRNHYTQLFKVDKDRNDL